MPPFGVCTQPSPAEATIYFEHIVMLAELSLLSLINACLGAPMNWKTALTLTALASSPVILGIPSLPRELREAKCPWNPDLSLGSDECALNFQGCVLGGECGDKCFTTLSYSNIPFEAHALRDLHLVSSSVVTPQECHTLTARAATYMSNAKELASLCLKVPAVALNFAMISYFTQYWDLEHQPPMATFDRVVLVFLNTAYVTGLAAASAAAVAASPLIAAFGTLI
jgi:hypothetical protein